MIWKPSTLRAIRHSMSAKTEYAIEVEYEHAPDTTFRGASSPTRAHAGQQFVALVPDRGDISRQIGLVVSQYEMGLAYASKKTSYDRNFRELLEMLRVPTEVVRGRDTFRAIAAKIRRNPSPHVIALVDFRRE